MSLKDFTRKEGIPIADIQLDENNVRFDDPPGSQLECQRRLLTGNDGKKLLNLAKHIAVNGVGLAPIVVSQNEDGRYTVRDGNRRIAALKFLNNPAGCSAAQHKEKFAQIRKRYEGRGNIISEVDCWIGHNEDAIFEHIDLQHAGQLDGAGQVPLETRARDRLKARRVGKKSRHGQVHRWLLDRQHLIPGIENLKLTNVQRLVGSKNNMEKLGFVHGDDGTVRPCKSEKVICKIWGCLLQKVNGVGDIYYAKQRNPLIDSAVEEAEGLLAMSEGPKVSPGGDQKTKRPASQRGDEYTGAGSPLPPTRGGATSPRKHSTDRSKLIVEGRHSISIPQRYQKARNVLLELKKLNVKDHPIAGAMLLRALFEHTFYAYCKVRGLLPNNLLTLKKLLALVVKDCEGSEQLKRDGKLPILQRIGDWKKLESLTTLNKCVHDDHYYLPASELCAFYDLYDYFFTYWWNEVATAE